MTGFGKGERELNGKRITVEIRSLNSKQLDLNSKIPSYYRESEFEVRSMISKALVRGKVDVYVNFELLGGKKSLTINKDVINEYYNQLKECDIEFNNADFLQTIMRLPEILMTEKNEITEDEKNLLLEATKEAIENIGTFRRQEGLVMITDILNHIDNIERLKAELLIFDETRIETIKKRIHDSLERLNLSIDESRFEQELIYYLEKLDINEEKIRLQSHLDYFRAVCQEEEGVGRKIGFITQEIGREINTMGSKSNNTQMQQIVVRMKDELEKVKEQSLNIL